MYTHYLALVIIDTNLQFPRLTGSLIGGRMSRGRANRQSEIHENPLFFSVTPIDDLGRFL